MGCDCFRLRPLPMVVAADDQAVEVGNPIPWE